MKSGCTIIRFRKAVALSLLFVLSSAVNADVAYEYRDEAGELVISDVKPEGVDDVRIIQLPVSPPEVDTRKSVIDEQRRRASEIRLQNRIERRRQAKQNVELARKVLAEAENALEEGKKPQPGDHRGTVSGGTRLTEAYFSRIEKLELDVTLAKETLQRAQRDYARLPK